MENEPIDSNAYFKNYRETKKVERARKIYKTEYVELMKKHINEGWSYESFAGKIKVSRDYVYIWRRLFPEFKAVCTINRYKSFWEHYYENRGIKK